MNRPLNAKALINSDDAVFGPPVEQQTRQAANLGGVIQEVADRVGVLSVTLAEVSGDVQDAARAALLNGSDVMADPAPPQMQDHETKQAPEKPEIIPTPQRPYLQREASTGSVVWEDF